MAIRLVDNKWVWSQNKLDVELGRTRMYRTGGHNNKMGTLSGYVNSGLGFVQQNFDQRFDKAISQSNPQSGLRTAIEVYGHEAVGLNKKTDKSDA